MAWLATCRFHKDPGDAATTQCKKSRSFTPATKDMVLRRLKVWCIAGKYCEHRAFPPEGSHLNTQPEDLPDMTDEVLELEVPDATIAREDWLEPTRPADPAAPAPPGSTSNSSSSSNSSTSSD
eukprot:4997927-Pyramimonas_sp.AAC.1